MNIGMKTGTKPRLQLFDQVINVRMIGNASSENTKV